MRKRKPKSKPIDEFLHSSVRKKPVRKNRSKLFGILLLVAAIVIIGLMWFRLGSGPAPLEVYSLNDLSIEEVSEYLEMYPAGIFINDRDQGIRDTITSLTEFLSLIPEAEDLSTNDSDPFNNNLSLDTLTLVEEGGLGFTEEVTNETNEVEPEFLVDNTSPVREPLPQPEVSKPRVETRPKDTFNEPPIASTSKVESRPPANTSADDSPEFKTYEMEITGERKQGFPLTIDIKDFDPQVSYFMDYGNGVTQRVKLRHSFSYENPGNYDMKLIAIDQKTGRKSSYSENLIILPGEEIPVEAEPMAVEEETAEETSMEEIATPPEAGPSAAIVEDAEDPLSERGILEGNEGAIDESSAETAEAEEAGVPANLNAPLKIVEVLPSFPGGLSALNRFIQREQQYPNIARENGIKGKVYLQFTVSEQGKLEDVKVLRGIGYGCDEEALRLLSIMPDWIPGRHSGRVVPVLYTLPISFRLN